MAAREFIARSYEARERGSLTGAEIINALQTFPRASDLLTALRTPGKEKESEKLFSAAISLKVQSKALAVADGLIAQGSITIAELDNILNGQS